MRRNETFFDPSKSSPEVKTILDCAAAVSPLRTPLGQPYISLSPNPTSRMIFSVRSGMLRDWIVSCYFYQYGTPPPARALQRVLQAFEAQARCAEFSERILPRIAAVRTEAGESVTLIHLGNSEGEFVRITEQSWEVANGTEYAFSWHQGNDALPKPIHPEDPSAALAALRDLLNLSSERDWLRILAFLVSSLRPDGPFPVLVLDGPSGSGKSTAARLLRSLVDPAVAPLLPPPTRARDILYLASRSWLLAFDHVSSIPAAVADSLCRISTGAGRTFRDGPGDSEPFFDSLRRPVILTAAEGFRLRSDLAARSLSVRLPAIPAAARRTEASILADFHEHSAAILGALCTAAGAALRRFPEIRLPHAPLFADAATAAVAAAPTLGVSEEEMLAAILDTPPLPPDPLAESLRQFMDGRAEWVGSASELLAALNPPAGSAGWPGRAKDLSQNLRRIAGFLKPAGLTVEFGKSNGNRSIRVAQTTPTPSAISDPEDPNYLENK